MPTTEISIIAVFREKDYSVNMYRAVLRMYNEPLELHIGLILT